MQQERARKPSVRNEPLSAERKKVLAERVKPLLAEAHRAKRHTEGHLRHEKFTLATIGRPWNTFRDRGEGHLEAMDVFFPGSRDAFEDCKIDITQKGGRVVAAEIAGAGDMSEIGADATVNLILNQDIGTTPSSTQTIVAGDIFLRKTREQFLQTVKSAGSLGLVIFNPEGGASLYAKNKFSHLIIRQFLRDVYDLLVPGGQIYVNLNYVVGNVPLADAFTGTDAMVEQADTRRLEGGEKGTPINVFRITKPKDNATVYP